MRTRPDLRFRSCGTASRSCEAGAKRYAEAVRSCALTASPRGAPSRQVGRPLGGASTARPLEACERLMSGFLQRHGPLPRHARTLKTTWCAWQWRPPLPSALPRGRPVASERAAWWCCWWQILRPARRLRPPAVSSLPYRPRVIRHVRPLTEGVGEWRLATLQHTLSSERETLLTQCRRVSRPREMCLGTQSRLRGRSGHGPGTAAGRPAQGATAAPRQTSPREVEDR